MSAIAYYSEPYKLPAGVLALMVHGVLFALLYFGVNWRADPPQGMVVDIWESLPSAEVAQAKVAPPPVEQVEPPKPVELPPVEQVEPPKPVEPPKSVEPVQPVAPPKADIELVEKKKPKIKPVESKKPVVVKKPIEVRKQVQQKKTEPVKKVDQQALAQQAAQAEQARARAAQAAEAAAAITNEVGKYKGLISSKIRHKIVLPPDVPDNAQAEFDVTLLPDGEVLGDPKLVKSSGNAAYDDAVERGILKAQPLPLPPDAALFKEFRELHLKFSPKELGEI